jgi:hypothetical protein
MKIFGRCLLSLINLLDSPSCSLQGSSSSCSGRRVLRAPHSFSSPTPLFTAWGPDARVPEHDIPSYSSLEPTHCLFRCVGPDGFHCRFRLAGSLPVSHWRSDTPPTTSARLVTTASQPCTKNLGIILSQRRQTSRKPPVSLVKAIVGRSHSFSSPMSVLPLSIPHQSHRAHCNSSRAQRARQSPRMPSRMFSKK